MAEKYYIVSLFDEFDSFRNGTQVSISDPHDSINECKQILLDEEVEKYTSSREFCNDDYFYSEDPFFNLSIIVKLCVTGENLKNDREFQKELKKRVDEFDVDFDKKCSETEEYMSKIRENKEIEMYKKLKEKYGDMFDQC